MDPVTIGVLALVALLVLIGLRVPIAASLIAVSFVGIWAVAGLRPAMSMLSTIPYTTSASWTLSSIPMFLLMGYIAFHSGLTRGLFEAARVWWGWLPGGLAIASLAGASGFAAVSGSSVACSAAIGRIAVPEMARAGYDLRIATGSVAAGGTIGALIPPSIILILFGIQAETSINDLFLGGLILGLGSLAFYVAAVLIVWWRHPERLPRAAGHSMGDRWKKTLEIWPVLLLIGAVFGGLFSGIFTATEAGAFGSFMALAIGIGRRTLSWARFKESLVDTLLSSGSLFIIAIGANLFTRLVAMSGLSMQMGDFVDGLGLGTLTLLLLIVLIYLVIGMFLEPIGALLLTLPLFLPVLAEHGVDKLWFGLLVAKLLEIGMITPPVGLNVFVIHSVARDYVRLEQIFAGIVPFILADLALVATMLALRGFM
ncbi:TRAP transporter large permease subunit [Pseudooceanicola sp. CBS1P-1]|uniref:TRAP transporter large permease protein n=1 Tax=Pseudooceanicola albus TaxID=2692189 RepID=A0A6L7G3G1_9RHOB|nr:MULTISPECIES: TRAP transporter large permease subunit [Pseudooceanicola]MBT9385052.1 TRAP transporter large permease subunit [Pseudooceanicola endophyticus]MXN18655.1 TRAP transporter large permease subunit [Pseudooceanicola albus]